MRSFFSLFIFSGLAAAILLCHSVIAITPLDADSMEARVVIMNTVTFAPAGPDYKVSDAQGTLTWYPRENLLQEVSSITTEPAGTRGAESIAFSWTNPGRTKDITLISTVKTRNAIVPVRERIPFPLENVTPDLDEYLIAGEITDDTPEIRALAQQLAAGKDDEYEVVYALADWTTTNVKYSLASLGQPASQKSSQVLQSRQGKCDELTSLFISMNRALGIPARFVAGYSYTNSAQFKSRWGGHGWAEIWMPDQGWVPFDVTYGEYGYLDAGHVTLKIAPDAKETSIDFSAKGVDFELITEPLDITVTPTKLTEQQSTPISISLDAPNTVVGFGSAVLILATVKNTRDYYVSTRLDLAKTTNTDELSTTYENILLKPREQRIIPFLVKIDDTLKPGYEYSFPFKVYSRLGEEATISIAVNQDAPIYDKSAYESIIESYTQSPSAIPEFTVTCEQGLLAYARIPIKHSCAVTGIAAPSIVVCEKTCQTIAVNGGKFTLETTDNEPGVYTRAFAATTGGKTSRFFVTSRSIAQSVIGIVVAAPAAITPDQIAEITVTLNHTGAMPKNLTIKMQALHATGTSGIKDLSRPAILSYQVPGRELRPGENDVVATVSGVDELGTPVSAQGTTSITLNGATPLDKMQFWFEDAGYWLAGLFS